MRKNQFLKFIEILQADAVSFDIHSIFQFLKSFYLNAGFSSVVIYRVQTLFTRRFTIFLAKFLSRINLSLNGIDFVIGSNIGPGLRVNHPVGIVVGNRVVAGSNLILMQNVTLGQKGFDSTVTNLNLNPVIGNNVSIGANSVILGGIRVGNNCEIGACTFLSNNVPDDSVVIGNPAKIR